MRRVHVIALILAAAMLFAGTAGAETFKAGRDYEVLPFPAEIHSGNKIEVQEFFWYGCPHCYAFEPHLVQWLKHKPADVEFVRTPAVTPRWRVHAVTFYAMQDMGVVARLHDPFFTAVHKQEQQNGEGVGPLFEKDGIADWLASHGVDKNKFLATYDSFGVQLKVNRAKQMFNDYNLDGVPNLIIDGRYRTSPSLAHGEERTLRVVDYLVRKARAERHHRS
jgi:thiol:disulfide interchange protein DsbA